MFHVHMSGKTKIESIYFEESDKGRRQVVETKRYCNKCGKPMINKKIIKEKTTIF